MNSTGRSLEEVNESVDTTKPRKGWRRIAAFFGPAYLISVGYMDPGNWATDLQGGSLFGYRLIWVLVMSNIMALLLQSLCARLGIVRGRDLAQCNREAYPKGLNFILYVFAELAIAACDLAEVLGMAVGLQLLLGLPLIWGVLITLLDTFLLLYLQKLGMRKMEAFIIALVGIIGVCFLVEMLMAHINGPELLQGLIPSLPVNPDTPPGDASPSRSVALYLTIGIIGATVMPHNLYLHSALVQTRRIKRDDDSIRKAIRFNVVDSAIALNLALFVNAAILILAAAAFHSSGHSDVAQLKDAHLLLKDLLGSAWASHLFAIALIAAGQSSTITGTLAGQIVMEGYLHLRINPLMRRLLTRLLAIVPAVLVILIMGEEMVDEMLVFSQVLLSMQLGFAVIPLIHFVSDKKGMGKFAIGIWTKIAVWTVAALVVGLNLWMLGTQISKGIEATDNIALQALLVAGGVGLMALLVVTIVYPLRKKGLESADTVHSRQTGIITALPQKPADFRIIALALDFSDKDSEVIRYALMLAVPQTRFVLMHIVESAPAKLSGNDTEDLETRRDREQLESYAKLFTDANHSASMQLGFRNRAAELARLVNESGADLLVVGSHGHKGVRDWLFGETINSLRHAVKVPVFIAR